MCDKANSARGCVRCFFSGFSPRNKKKERKKENASCNVSSPFQDDSGQPGYFVVLGKYEKASKDITSAR